MDSLCSAFLLLICFGTTIAFEYFLSNNSGEVQKGNFMYYSMLYEGTILLELTSFSGDCDLYVSQTKKKPSYEPDLNCLQSATCGVDSVIVPKSFKRPVAIGIFGYPSHEVCTYNLMFFRVRDSRDIFNFDPYQESNEIYINKKLKRSDEYGSGESELEEESFFWVFLRYAVIFFLEIIM